MDTPTAKSKNKILNFLPKAAQATAVAFQNLPFSPGRDRLRTHHNKGFSGPFSTSMIPPEARRRSKNFETQEPTSPKVSCIGQIKPRKNRISKKNRLTPPPKARMEKSGKPWPANAELKEKPSGVWKLFGPGRKSDASINFKPPSPQKQPSAPGIGQMKKFASSRDTFANFDWTAAQITPEGEERRDFDDSDEETGYSGGEDEVRIPFSAPILMGPEATEPRKEINLWKRRTMGQQPKPLELSKIR